MTPIPIDAAKRIAKTYGYDQVVIYARKTGDAPGNGEHMATYGVSKVHCDIAAQIGMTLKRWMGWK